MPPQYNQYNLEASFRNFLRAENASTATLKNYLSDFRHFLGWAVVQHRVTINSDIELANLITVELLEAYRGYMTSHNLPTKTVNRRLSTLRKFCSFCISQGWMEENPAKKLGNIALEVKPSAMVPAELIQEYKKYLESAGFSNNIIDKNITDVNELVSLKISN